MNFYHKVIYNTIKSIYQENITRIKRNYEIVSI